MRPRSAPPGFTLIEIAVVLLVIGIVTAVSVPSLSAVLSSTPLERSVDAVVTLLRAERLEAVRAGVPRQLVLTDGGGIRTAAGRVRLPESVAVQPATSDGVVIFYPTGLSSGAAWRLEDAAGGTRVIRVSLLESAIAVEP